MRVGVDFHTVNVDYDDTCSVHLDATNDPTNKDIIINLPWGFPNCDRYLGTSKISFGF